MLKVDHNISTAHTIDKSFYLDPDYFEKSKKEIFACTWQYIGFKDNVAEVGDVYPITLLPDLLDEPLLVVQSPANEYKCLSNVCTHRGNLLVYHPCSKQRQLTCKYHGRSFDLNGKFKFMPEFKEVENFPSQSDDLQMLPLESWGPLLFTRLSSGHSFEDFFGEIKNRISWIDLRNLQFSENQSKTFELNANWALYCENYLEGFHIPFVHAGLNEILDFGEYTTELFKYSNLQLGIAKEGESVFDIPESSQDHGKKIAAYYFWVFPNMMFNFYPWGLSLNIIEPIGPQKTKIR